MPDTVQLSPKVYREFLRARPTLGMFTDRPTWEIPDRGWSLVRNARLFDGFIRKSRGWTRLLDGEGDPVTLDGTVGLIRNLRYSDGTEALIAATDKNIYNRAGGLWNAVNASPYAANPLTWWELDNLGENVILNRRDGALLPKKLTSGGALTDISAAPKGVSIQQFENHLLIGGLTNYSGDALLDNFIGSALGDVELYNIGAVGTDAIKFPLLTGNDQIQRILRLGSYVVFYMKDAIILINYISGSYIYQKLTPLTNIGTPAPASVIGYRGVHYFIAGDDIYFFNGAEPVPVGTPIWTYYAGHVQNLGAASTYSWYNAVEQALCFVFQSSDASQFGAGYYFDKMMVFSLREKAWSIRDFPFSAIGPMNLAARIEIWDGVFATTTTWDEGQLPWSSPDVAPLYTLVAGDQDGKLWKVYDPNDQYKADTDDVELELISGDTAYGDPLGWKIESGMRIGFPAVLDEYVEDSASLTRTKVYVCARDHLEQPVVWQGPYTPRTDGRVDYLATGRWFRHRFVHSQGPFGMTGWVTLVRARGRN